VVAAAVKQNKEALVHANDEIQTIYKNREWWYSAAQDIKNRLTGTIGRVVALLILISSLLSLFRIFSK